MKPNKTDSRYSPIPCSSVISNCYYDRKHGGKAGRRARKTETRKLIREYL